MFCLKIKYYSEISLDKDLNIKIKAKFTNELTLGCIKIISKLFITLQRRRKHLEYYFSSYDILISFFNNVSAMTSRPL